MRFSIIVTSFNQRQFIRQSVDSALAVSGPQAEVIVVDDASTDGSREILHAYGDAIRLLALPVNQGAAAARNSGLRLASGDYLVFLDGDDALAPWALKVYERVIETDRPKLILASLLWFSGERPVLDSAAHPREIRIAQYQDYMKKDRTFGPSATALVVERKALLQVRGWSHDFPVMEDVDLLMKLGDASPAVQILSPYTALYRVHSGNTVNNVPRYLEQFHRLLDKERVGGYPGGRSRSFERRAAMGGHVVAFLKRAMKSGLYRDALALAALGWPMVCASAIRRCNLAIRRPRPCEILGL